MLCGDAGIPLLDGLLHAKGFMGKKDDPEMRACAAMALGRIKTPEARDILQRATDDKELVVRNAVNRALREVAA